MYYLLKLSAMSLPGGEVEVMLMWLHKRRNLGSFSLVFAEAHQPGSASFRTQTSSKLLNGAALLTLAPRSMCRDVLSSEKLPELTVALVGHTKLGRGIFKQDPDASRG